MSSDIIVNSHLSNRSRYVIEYELFLDFTPQEIIDYWEEEFHKRPAPSVQTVYGIKRLVDLEQEVKSKKTGPKNRTVLTDEVLDKLENLIEDEDTMTLESMSCKLEIPISTVHHGTKLLGMKKYNAIETPILTQDYMEKRIAFCNTYIKWNLAPQMKIWWSDECMFKVEELFNFNEKTYYAKENKFKKK